MKRLLAVMGGLLLSTFGCAPDVDLNNRPLFTNGSNAITFLLYDSVTGAGISNASITMSVGSYDLQPTKTDGNAYVISQVPAGTSLAHITADGYLDFEGQPVGQNCGTLTNPASQCFTTYQVALYPTKAVSEDFTVKVFRSSDGAPVTSGQVIAALTSAATLFGTPFSNPLPGTLTVRPSTLTVSIANGVAVLPKEQLVLGGTYQVNIFGAQDSAGAYLTPQTGIVIKPGQQFSETTVFMGAPAQDPVALTENNENGGVYGNLTFTFPYPMEVCSNATDEHWTVTGGGADGNHDGVIATPADSNQVTAAVSGDGSTVTVTANFKNNSFQPADGELDVTFTGVKLRIKGASNCDALSAIYLRNTPGVLHTTLQMAGPVSP